MKRSEFFKASGFRDTETEDLILVFNKAIPECKSLTQSRGIFKWQGEDIADALIKHLPGGTVDQVLRALLENRASLLCIPNKGG